MARNAPTVRPSIPERRIPPLQPGDHLTREEFERRYDATPGLKKAELIEGVVYMPPPVSFEWHAEPHVHLAGWAWTYRVSTPGVRGGSDASVRLREGNMPQPDVFLLIDPARGGQAKFSDDGYIEGAPELVCEVAASSAGIDLHEKREVYRRHGVREFIVWRTFDSQIDYFVLRGNQFIAHNADADGVFRSEIFPGLWLNAPALLQNDFVQFLHTLHDGIASPEHAAFVARLNP
jgi:Uma2 family endonuclease